jgi:hypothetical protein
MIDLTSISYLFISLTLFFIAYKIRFKIQGEDENKDEQEKAKLEALGYIFYKILEKNILNSSLMN